MSVFVEIVPAKKSASDLQKSAFYPDSAAAHCKYAVNVLHTKCTIGDECYETLNNKTDVYYHY